MKPSEILRGALVVLGAQGEHWLRGALDNRLPGVGADRWCQLGAMRRAVGAEYEHSFVAFTLAENAWLEAAGLLGFDGDIPTINDATDFSTVQLIGKHSIVALEEAGL